MSEKEHIIEAILSGPSLTTPILTESHDSLTAERKTSEKAGALTPVNRPIFIIGSPRSRTTSLGRSLTAHSRIAGLEKDSLFLLHLSDMYRSLLNEGYAPLAGHISGEDLRASLRGFSDRILGTVLSHQEKELYCDHTPWYGAISTFVQFLYPDAQFIHVVRDGRDVVESLGVSFKVGGKIWAGQNVTERINLWAKMVLLSRRVSDDSSRYLEVGSEDLLNSPTTTLKMVMNFLGLDFEASSLLTFATAHAVNEGHTPLLASDGGSYTPTWPATWTSGEKDYFTTVSSALGIPIR